MHPPTAPGFSRRVDQPPACQGPERTWPRVAAQPVGRGHRSLRPFASPVQGDPSEASHPRSGLMGDLTAARRLVRDRGAGSCAATPPRLEPARGITDLRRIEEPT